MNKTVEDSRPTPLISIIIATYNASRYLQECLSSIARQSFKEIEIVIIDGGSTDGTLEILNGFNSFPLTLLTEKDQGIYDALNKGIRLGKGKWFHFLGSDDLLLPGFSELARELKNDSTVYYGVSEPMYREGKSSYDLITGEFSRYRLAKYCMNHQAILYPAKVFDKYEYNLRYKIYADYDLNIKVWGDRAFKRIFLPISIVQYNMSGFSAGAKDELFKKEKPELIRKSMGTLMYWRFLLKRCKKRKQGREDFY